MTRIKAVVLGSSGLVAQRLLQRLAHHPWFETHAVAGSPQRVGKALSSLPWRLPEPRPTLPEFNVIALDDPAVIQRCRSAGVGVVFSALPTEVARHVEPMWAEAGMPVLSNAAAFRRVEGVPLVVPEVNPAELNGLSATQRPMVCATNCTLLPLLLPLTALHEAFGLKAWTMRSEQALSGGGYALIDEVARAGDCPPNIPGEAEKTEAEFRHLLNWEGRATLTCRRVNRLDGHHVFIEAEFEHELHLPAVVNALSAWSQRVTPRHLPSAPDRAIMLVDEVDPVNHVYADGTRLEAVGDPSRDLNLGMAVVVGNLEVSGRRVRFEALSHNTLRGAAGGVVYLAELAVDMGLLHPPQAQG